MTVKHLQRANSRRYRTAEVALADLDTLVGHGLGEWVDGPPPERGGHAVRYFVPADPHAHAAVDGPAPHDAPDRRAAPVGADRRESDPSCGAAHARTTPARVHAPVDPDHASTTPSAEAPAADAPRRPRPPAVAEAAGPTVGIADSAVPDAVVGARRGHDDHP